MKNPEQNWFFFLNFFDLFAVENGDKIMKLIAENQYVGNGVGFYIIRDLYEDERGRRTSVRKTCLIPEQGTKDLSVEEALKKYPKDISQ